ncbi:hypothetical protein D3C75_839350 [compost metagenome]
MLRRSRCRRQEARQSIDARLCVIEAADNQQGSGNHADPLRVTDAQGRVPGVQIHQQYDILPLVQMLHMQVLQQADRRFMLASRTGLFECHLPVALQGEPLAGASMPGAAERVRRQPLVPGQGGEHLQPAARMLPRFDETAQCLQLAQCRRSFSCTEQVFA